MIGLKLAALVEVCLLESKCREKSEFISSANTLADCSFSRQKQKYQKYQMTVPGAQKPSAARA